MSLPSWPLGMEAKEYVEMVKRLLASEEAKPVPIVWPRYTARRGYHLS